MMDRVIRTIRGWAFAALFVVLAVVPAAVPASAERPGPNMVVVELFMSQSCAACPPAMALLDQLADRDDVLALSWPVDYWDYTGWKDTLAAPDNAERQRAYNDHLGQRFMYTPQIFVNAAASAEGADQAQVLAAIERPAKTLRLPVTLNRVGNLVKVRIPKAKAALPATVWLVRYDHHQVVSVTAGENAGRTLKVPNVVRDATAIGTWRGDAMEFTFDMAALEAGGREACAILVQTQGTGPIIGAANMDLVPLGDH